VITSLVTANLNQPLKKSSMMMANGILTFTSRFLKPMKKSVLMMIHLETLVETLALTTMLKEMNLDAEAMIPKILLQQEIAAFVEVEALDITNIKKKSLIIKITHKNITTLRAIPPMLNTTLLKAIPPMLNTTSLAEAIPPMLNIITLMVVLTGNLTLRSASITTILLIVEMILVANIMILSQLHVDFMIPKISLLPENVVHVEEEAPEITLNQVNYQPGLNQKISREIETGKEDGTNQWVPCLQRLETP